MRACVYMRVRACEPGWVQRGRARVSSGQGLLRRADAGTLGAGLAAPVPHQALARTRVCTCMHTHIHACAHLCAQAGGSCPPVGDLASTRGGGGRHCLQRGDPAPHHTGTVARGGWLLPLQFAASVSPSSSLSPCPQIQAPTWGRGVVCGRTQESGHPSLGGGGSFKSTGAHSLWGGGAGVGRVYQCRWGNRHPPRAAGGRGQSEQPPRAVGICSAEHCESQLPGGFGGSPGSHGRGGAGGSCGLAGGWSQNPGSAPRLCLSFPRTSGPCMGSPPRVIFLWKDPFLEKGGGAVHGWEMPQPCPEGPPLQNPGGRLGAGRVPSTAWGGPSPKPARERLMPLPVGTAPAEQRKADTRDFRHFIANNYSFRKLV